MPCVSCGALPAMWNCTRCEGRICDDCRKSCEHCGDTTANRVWTLHTSTQTRTACLSTLARTRMLVPVLRALRSWKYTCAGAEVMECTTCGVRSTCVFNDRDCYEENCCGITRKQMVCCECRENGFPFFESQGVFATCLAVKAFVSGALPIFIRVITARDCVARVRHHVGGNRPAKCAESHRRVSSK